MMPAETASAAASWRGRAPTKAVTFSVAGVVLLVAAGFAVIGKGDKDETAVYGCGFIAGQSSALKQLGAPYESEQADCHGVRLRAIENGLTAKAVKEVYP